MNLLEDVKSTVIFVFVVIIGIIILSALGSQHPAVKELANNMISNLTFATVLYFALPPIGLIILIVTIIILATKPRRTL